MKNWKDTITKELHAKMEGINEKDFRFYRIAEFERMINRTDNLSAKCNECQSLKLEIEKTVETIEKAIHTPGKLRRNYDHLIDRMAKHQRKSHGFYPPYYYTYNYSFWGMLAGTMAGTLLGYFIMYDFIGYFVLSGFVVGLLTSRIWGSRKDKAVRANEKLL